MKKYISILFVSMLFMVSCGDEELIVFDTENGFIQFASPSASLQEGDESVVTTILLGSGTNDSGVTVNFTVTSSDPSRYNVTPSSGSLEIPAGEFSADIVIEPIDNLLVDGDEVITLELSTGSSVPVGIGGEGNEGVSRTITIIDDDCPVDINAFVGTYSVAEVFTSGVNEGLTLAGAFGESYQVEISLAPGDPTGTKIVLNNSAGFNQYFVDGTVMTFNACPGTVSFDAGNPNIAAFADMTIETSSYDEGNPTITCDGPLGGFGPYQFVLTKM